MLCCDSVRKIFKKELKDYRDNNTIDTIYFSDFVENMLDILDKETSIEYPYTVKVAPSIDDMLRGNFEPSKIITVTNPILYKGKPIWTGNTKKKIDIQFGYENGDKRYLSSFSLDGKLCPHGTLAGATGSGKSVTSNAIIFSMLFQYAPWELDLLLSDAKIAEFKRYGVGSSIPHISSIAATGDSGYVISMLDKYIEDMNKMNEIFGSVGVQNLTDFREETGLTIPRHVLYMDEYQACMKAAGRRVKEIQSALDSAGRLGRNTGYHMMLASQEVGEEVRSILPNIRLRACLKSGVKVSEMILGNSQGSLGNTGLGKIYVTSNSDSGDVRENRFYRVPFQSKELFREQSDFLNECGDRMNFKRNVNFYDEESKFYREDLTKLMKYRETSGSIIIGVPSFICPTPDYYKLEFDNKDVENIVIFCNSIKELNRYFQTMYENSLRTRELDRKSVEVFLYADDSIMGDIIPENDGFKLTYRLKGTDDITWDAYCKMIYIKMLILQVDELAFSTTDYTEEDAKELEDYFSSIVCINEINKSRLHYAKKIINQSQYQKAFNLNSLSSSNKDNYIRNYIKRLFNTVKVLGSDYQNIKVTKKDLPNVNIHVVGANKVNGLGRDVSMSSSNATKKVLMDSYEANVRFIFYTTNMEEISSIRTGFRYAIMDGVAKDASKLKCDLYPEVMRDACGLLFDMGLNKANCFKKMQLPII